MFAGKFWQEPWDLWVEPIAITDRLFYVGNENVSCHLVVTGAGAILIDTAFAQTTYQLTESIRRCGVDPDDIKVITHSHGHVDHCGATRRMKELTGATLCLGEADVETVQEGTPLTCAEYAYGMSDFETFTVDRPLRHMDAIELGDVVMRCHHTPGHSPGVMTYTFGLPVDGDVRTVGLFGGPGLWSLTDEHRVEQGYPENRDDFAKSLSYLKTLDVEVWLGAHPGAVRHVRQGRAASRRRKPQPLRRPVRVEELHRWYRG